MCGENSGHPPSSVLHPSFSVNTAVSSTAGRHVQQSNLRSYVSISDSHADNAVNNSHYRNHKHLRAEVENNYDNNLLCAVDYE